MSVRRSSARWALPAGAVAVIGAVLAGTALAGAASAPRLPRTTPAALLAAVRKASPPAAFTATVTETAALGLPQLPDIGGVSTPLAALTGTHALNIWASAPRHLRVEWPSSFGERDLRVNGSQAWLWDSRTQTATRLVAPHGVRTGDPPAGLPPAPPAAARPDLTPLKAAQQLLAAVGPATAVGVGGTTTVAGRNAYLLVVAPRSPQSLIRQIRIAVDAKLHLPLQVQVYARGASGPALTVGFTALTIGRPAASNFTFTPPAGAKIRTETVPFAGLPGPGALVGVPGMPGVSGWSGLPPGARLAPAGIPLPEQLRRGGHPVFVLICSRHGKRQWVFLRMPRRLGARPFQHPPVPAGAIRLPCPLRGGASSAVFLRPGPARLGARLAGGPAGPRVLGSGWLSVLVLPASPVITGVSPGSRPVPASSGSARSGFRPAAAMPAGLSGPLGSLGPLAATLLRAATPVRGAWGSGRLLRTALLSVLITDNGRILVGAVTPAVLYADVASAK